MLVVVGAAIGAGVRPLFDAKSSPRPAPPTYTNQQVTQAKTAICTAYQRARQALDIAGARDAGDDPTAQLAVATGTRQALDVGGRYLITILAGEPATAPEVASAVHDLANAYRELTIDYLDGLPNSDPNVDSLRRTTSEAATTIQRLCK